jgi:DNA-binding CsgD family transcriptional regulator
MWRSEADPIIIGRSSELDRVTGVLEEVPHGPGRLVLIEGEAGIGKTAFLQEVLRRAEARGFQVFTAGVGELDRDLPFGAMATALQIGRGSADPSRREIADLLSGEGSLGVALSSLSEIPGVRFRVLEAVLALIERLALSAPVALAIEDLHWADPSTLLCLDHLARQLPYISMVLVGTARPPPQATELRRILDQLVAGDGEHIALARLDEESVAELVQRVVGLPPGPSLLGAIQDAGGNPLYVREFLSALDQEGGIEPSNGLAELRVRSFPPSLRLVILKQLGTLSRDALDVLRVASVLGSTFSAGDLAIVLGKESSALLIPLDECVQAGVLGEAGEHLTFRHELVREAIYSDLTSPMRAALHSQAAAALARVGAPATQVASHLVLGTRPPGDRTAAEWLARAAREAGPGAPDIAVELLQRAVGLLPSPDHVRDGLVVELAKALLLAGRWEDAEDLTRQMLAGEHDLSVDPELRFVLARSLNVAGRMAEAADEMARAAEDPSASDEVKTRLLAESALNRVMAGILPGSEAMAEDARARAARTGDRVAVGASLSASCGAAYFQGYLEEAVSFGREAVLAADETTVREWAAPPPSLYLGVVLIEADQVDEAQGVLRTGRSMADRVAPHHMRHPFHLALGLGQIQVGEWDDAIAEIETALSLMDETGAWSGSVFGRSAVGLVALHRGDLQSAGVHLTEAERDFAAVGPQFLADWMWWVRALLHEALDEPEQGLRVLNEAWEMCVGVGLVSELRLLGPDLVRLTLVHGDAGRAGSIAKAVEEAASLAHVSSLEGAALRCRGLVDRDPDVLLASVAAYRRSPRRLERALTSEDAATMLAERGRSDEAIGLLGEAVDVYEHLGAVRDVARADAALRSLGVRRGRRGSRRRPATGWDSLTPTERKVVRLAAEGLTNAQIGEQLFISRRTVETHLSHVFGKVGVSSRVQLATEASRQAGQERPLSLEPFEGHSQ